MGENNHPDWRSFQDSPLDPWLKKHLASVGIQKPTPIQIKLIQTIISPLGKRIKKNVLACSSTGTGKTLAYLLPILQFLCRDIKPYYALIILPTRELAYQVYEIVTVLTGESSMIKTHLMIGGGKTNVKTQGFWTDKPNIIVSTPGKFLEQITRQTDEKSVPKFDFLVLDEADLLIGPTFGHQLREILTHIDHDSRQTLVLSATLTSVLSQLQEMFADTAVTINLLPTLEEMKCYVATNPNLDQRYIVCPEAMKPSYLVQCLSDISFKQAIIFCSSTRQATLLHMMMQELGFDEEDVRCNPVLLVGKRDQKERLAALQKFKSLKSRIMVATGGLAGRGLDLPQVDLVILYNCPTNPVDYIHRVGRTCRMIDHASIEARIVDEQPIKRAKLSAAASRYLGKSILFVTQYDIELLHNIERYVGIKMCEEADVDTDNVTGIMKPVAIALKNSELKLIEESTSYKRAS